MSIKTTCKNCGKEFITKRSYLNVGKMQCCSMKCRDEFNIKKYSKPCSLCGKIFHPSRQTGKYCSKECFSRFLSSRRKGIHPAHLINKGFDSPKHVPWNKGTRGLSKPNKTSFKPGRISPCGKDHPSYKGGRREINSGYIIILNPEKSGKYVQEHRFIMEQYIGRKLTSNEIVHHINGIKNDNRIENLEILLRKTHHGKVFCPYCENEFFIK